MKCRVTIAGKEKKDKKTIDHQIKLDSNNKEAARKDDVLLLQNLTSSSSSSSTSTNSIGTTEPPKQLSLLDDNSSFFSYNSFHKIVPDESRTDTDNDSCSPATETPTQLADCLPDINTSEDWAAAFGFPKMEQIVHQQQRHQHHTNNLNQSEQEFYHRPAPTANVTSQDDFRWGSFVFLNLRFTRKTNGLSSMTGIRTISVTSF